MITIFYIALLVQIFFWLFIFCKLAFYQNKEKEREQNSKVSVIIAARNEFNNLQKLIPVIFQQDYKNYEVIVANDCSEDKSLELLHSFQRKYKNFKVIDIREVEEGYNSKKYALTKAIEKVNGEIILLTDADCLPTSSEWISRMVSEFDENTDIVLGFSPYYKENKSILNAFIRFETLCTAIQYLSFVLVGSPYMGVGRNLAYRKKVFDENKGFNKNKNIKGGDDDLLIGQIANSKNTKICIDKKSFMYSIPEKTWENWWIQKTRHLSVGRHYKLKIQLLLTLLHLSHSLVYLLFFLALISNKISPFIVIFFCLRLLMVYIIYISVNRKLQVKLQPWQVLCFDLLYILYIFIIGFWANSTQKITWK